MKPGSLFFSCLIFLGTFSFKISILFCGYLSKEFPVCFPCLKDSLDLPVNLFVTNQVFELSAILTETQTRFLKASFSLKLRRGPLTSTLILQHIVFETTSSLDFQLPTGGPFDFLLLSDNYCDVTFQLPFVFADSFSFFFFVDSLVLPSKPQIPPAFIEMVWRLNQRPL